MESEKNNKKVTFLYILLILICIISAATLYSKQSLIDKQWELINTQKELIDTQEELLIQQDELIDTQEELLNQQDELLSKVYG